MMNKNAYPMISGVFFGLVSLTHLLRVIFSVSAQVGTWMVPMWMSWLAIVVTGALCVWGFRQCCGSSPGSPISSP